MLRSRKKKRVAVQFARKILHAYIVKHFKCFFTVFPVLKTDTVC